MSISGSSPFLFLTVNSSFSPALSSACVVICLGNLIRSCPLLSFVIFAGLLILSFLSSSSASLIVVGNFQLSSFGFSSLFPVFFCTIWWDYSYGRLIYVSFFSGKRAYSERHINVYPKT